MKIQAIEPVCARCGYRYWDCFCLAEGVESEIHTDPCEGWPLAEDEVYPDPLNPPPLGVWDVWRDV